MWEQDSSLFINNYGLLPLASLTRTDLPQALLSQVAEEIAKIPDRVIRQNTAAYTEILAGLRFEKNLIRQLLSEDIMQESVIYQDILQKGKQQEAFQVINILLNRRFNKVNQSLIDRVRVLSTEQLENLAGAFVDFTQVSDLEAWLNQHERS
jgi:predicted transposase YdaD